MCVNPKVEVLVGLKVKFNWHNLGLKFILIQIGGIREAY